MNDQTFTLVTSFINISDEEVTLSFELNRPSNQAVSRAMTEMQKDLLRGSRNLVMAAIPEAERQKQSELFDQYPGLTVTLATGIMQRMGFSSLGN